MLFSSGRDRRFFELIRLAADNAHAIVELLAATATDMQGVAERAARAKELESQGDSYTHELLELLNRTFVTPLDREDLFTLAVQIDNVVDEVEAAMSRLAIYRLEGQVDDAVQQFARILRECAAELVAAVRLLQEKQLLKLHDHCVRLNVLENDADQVLRRALESLFEDEANPLRVIQWKEIYEILERATDACENVANVLEGVAMKHA